MYSSYPQSPFLKKPHKSTKIIDKIIAFNDKSNAQTHIPPSLHSPKSAILTYPSVSSSRLSNFRSLDINRKKSIWHLTDLTDSIGWAYTIDQFCTYTQSCCHVKTGGRAPHRQHRTCKQMQWHNDVSSNPTGHRSMKRCRYTLHTQPAALWIRRRGCASWDLRPLCTPWQNTRALVSESMRTDWPGTGAESCSLSQRSASHTSGWQSEADRSLNNLKYLRLCIKRM